MLADPQQAEAHLRSLAAARGVDVFSTLINRQGDLVFGLRKGEYYGEFDVSHMTIFGSLSNGFDIGAGEVELDEMLWAAVEFVARMEEGRLGVVQQRGLLWTRDVLEGDDLLYAHRSKRVNWWNPGGPYEVTFMPDR